MKVVLAILGAAFVAGIGFAAGFASRRSEAPATSTVVQGLPAAVERTRAGILTALAAHDDAALNRLVPDRSFTYTFGGVTPGGAVAYWNKLEVQGPTHPLTTLARILRLPYSLRQGVYVWPFAYGVPKGELTAYERRLLGPLVRSYAGEDYYGYRAGIKPDGAWSFYVSGD